MTTRISLKLAANGRVVLPRALRDAMGISGETKLLATVENGEVRLSTVEQRVRRAQALYRKFAGDGGRTVDDFLADRRREADAEEKRERTTRSSKQD